MIIIIWKNTITNKKYTCSVYLSLYIPSGYHQGFISDHIKIIEKVLEGHLLITPTGEKKTYCFV
jgi:hypothetical protein